MRTKNNGNIIFGKCAKLVALITRNPYLGERVYLKSLLYTLVFFAGEFAVRVERVLPA